MPTSNFGKFRMEGVRRIWRGKIHSPSYLYIFKSLLIIFSASILQALFYGMEFRVVLRENQSQRKSDELLTDVIPFLKKRKS
jgi:hypothetical protein